MKRSPVEFTAWSVLASGEKRMSVIAAGVVEVEGENDAKEDDDGGDVVVSVLRIVAFERE
jgi:hypothetical protein